MPCRHERSPSLPSPPAGRADQAAHVGAPDRPGRGPVRLAARPRGSRTRSPTSRPRTPTPRRSSTSTPTSSRSCSRRSSRGSRRPTSRCPCATARGGTSPAPSRASRTRCSAAAASIDDATDVVLDCNVEAEGHDFFDVHAVDVVARPHAARLVERHRRRRALHAAGPRPRHRRRPPRRADRDVVVGRAGLVERRRSGCSTPGPTSRCARTRSGGTASARPSPTTGW